MKKLKIDVFKGSEKIPMCITRILMTLIKEVIRTPIAEMTRL